MNTHRMVPLLIVVGCFGLTEQRAFAAIETNDDIKLSAYGSHLLGPYRGQIYDDATSGVGTGTSELIDFLTFCVERFEFFNNGLRYNIDDHDATASANSNHLLSAYTSWVYQKFLNEVIPELVLTPGSAPTMSATPTHVDYDDYTYGQIFDAYQHAIWGGMIDVSYDPDGDGPIVTGLMSTADIGGARSELYGLSVNLDNSIFSYLGISKTQFIDTGIDMYQTGSIRVLNLSRNGQAAQDQVFLVPELSQAPVPEPASMVVFGTLFALVFGLHWYRRRR